MWKSKIQPFHTSTILTSTIILAVHSQLVFGCYMYDVGDSVTLIACLDVKVSENIYTLQYNTLIFNFCQVCGWKIALIWSEISKIEPLRSQ